MTRPDDVGVGATPTGFRPKAYRLLRLSSSRRVAAGRDGEGEFVAGVE